MRSSGIIACHFYSKREWRDHEPLDFKIKLYSRMALRQFKIIRTRETYSPMPYIYQQTNGQRCYLNSQLKPFEPKQNKYTIDFHLGMRYDLIKTQIGIHSVSKNNNVRPSRKHHLITVPSNYTIAICLEVIYHLGVISATVQ